jgi:O-antigen ligase
LSSPFDLRETPLRGRFSLFPAWSIAALLLLLASWLVPLHFLPWVSWHSEAPVFLSMCLLSLATLIAWIWREPGRSPQLTLPVSMLLWPALCVLVALQWLAGQIGFAGDALVLALYFVLCGVAWGLGYGIGTVGQEAVVRRQQALEAVAWTLLAGALGSAVIALVQVADVWDSASWISRMPSLRRPGGNLNQPNQLATLLIMGLVSLVLLCELKRLQGLAAGLLFAVLALGIAATESRTGLLSLGVLSVWCVAGWLRMHLRLRPWAVGLGLLICVVLYFAWPILMGLSGQFSPDAQLNTKAGLRLVVWPQLIEAIAMKPWAGWGLREVSAAHNAVADGYMISEPYTYAHNLGLELAIGVGLPATVLLIAFAGVWLWWRLLRCQDVWAWFCVAAVLPVALHSMLEFPFAYAYFLAPVMFLLGTLEAMTGARAAFSLSARKMVVLISVFSALLIASGIEYLKIEEDFRVVRFEALRVGKTPEDHQRPDVLLLTQLDALLVVGRITPNPQMDLETLELARKAALRFPWTAVQNRYALSLALNGQPEEAHRQLKVMKSLHGEKAFDQIRTNWQELANERFPTLREFVLPGPD